LSRYRIAEVGERISGSGAAEATSAAASSLRRAGHSVRLFAAEEPIGMTHDEVSTFGDWSTLYRLIDQILQASRRGRPTGRQVIEYHRRRRQVIQKLIRELRSFEPDVVHLHNVAAVLSHLGVLELRHKWPVVWTLHDRFAFDLFHNEWEVGSTQRSEKSWEKTVSGGAASTMGRDLMAASNSIIDFITPSKWLAELASASPLGIRHRIHSMPNIISTVPAASSISGDELRDRLSIDRVLMSVIPDPRYTLKGFDILEQAFRLARLATARNRSDPFVRLGLVVTTSEDLEMQSECVFTIPDLRRVGFEIGPAYLDQGAMRDLYTASDAVVIASRAENLPNVAIEAIRDGCPVIATDVGGMREIFDTGDVGRLVPTSSASQMAAAMLEVVVRRGRSRYQSDLARSWTASFSPEVVLPRIESVFREAVRGERG
jgi:glycosyltransferase involved in cell wall biosynthesis